MIKAGEPMVHMIDTNFTEFDVEYELLNDNLEYYAKNNTNNNANNNKKKKLKLTVMSNNIPAVTLYKSLGFTASGIYSILDSMTVMTRGALDFLIQMEKEI